MATRIAQWLHRAIGQSSMERAALIQSVKAAVAALLAWVVAAEVLHFTQPFLAPWSAIFIVAATVYRSVCSAAQQFAGAVVAVVLASVATELIPWHVAALFVAVLAGLLIGQWRVFGDSGTWIGITALLILTSGAMQESMLVERLIETAIGAAIGIAVNTLIAPPVYQLKAGDATARVGDELADVLDHMSSAVPSSETETIDVSKRSHAAIQLMRHAEWAVSLDNESRRLNPRLRTKGLGYSAHEMTLQCLRHTWSYTEELGQILQRSRTGPDHIDEESRRHLSQLFEHIATLVRLRCDDSTAAGDIEEAARRADTALDAVEHGLETSTNVTFKTVTTLVAIAAPARHAIQELSSR